MNNHSLLDVATSQLAIVDLQERLAAVIPEAERNRCLTNASLLLETARLLSVPVTTSEQYPDGLGHTSPIIQEHLPKNAPVISKTGFSCCAEPSYTERLDSHQRPQIVIAGLEAHVCVLQTALQLHAREYDVFLVEDAICARYQSDQTNAIQRMRSAGITITCTESVLFEWIRDASHQHFKTVSALVKKRRTS